METREFGYRKLIAWQRARELVVLLYQITSTFPKTEVYGLASQIRRAAVSVVANIAEGWLRRTIADKKRYFEIAQGSLLELDAEMDIAKEVGYVGESDYAKFVSVLHAANYLLDKYAKSM